MIRAALDAISLWAIPVMLVGTVLVVGAVEVAFRAQTGISRLQLMIEGMRAIG